MQIKSLESEESNSCLLYPLALEQITVSSCVIFHLSHRIAVRIKRVNISKKLLRNLV